MKKIDKLIFATITLAWIFPIVFFHKSFERWYVYNAFTNAFTWIFSIDENFKYLPIDNVIFNILALIAALVFIIYITQVLARKSLNNLTLILEFSCLAVFIYRFYNVISFSSYGEFYPTYAIALELMPIMFYFVSLALTIYKLIKLTPRHPTKAERMQAQIDELQKQVDELKKED